MAPMKMIDEIDEQAIDALQPGEVVVLESSDWEFVSELVEVDFEENDDFDYHICGREHPLVFLRGDIQVDGDTTSHELVTKLPDFELDAEEFGIVVVGDLAVSGHLDLDELSPLFVTGNVKASSITNSYGSLIVSGSIAAQFVFVNSADEGGLLHAETCATPLMISAGGATDWETEGPELWLEANGYFPRQKAALEYALTELGFDLAIETEDTALRALGQEHAPQRNAKLAQLVREALERKPDGVPDAAEWSDDYPPGYVLEERDDDGELHGVQGRWEADGTIEYVRHFAHGVPHGSWTTRVGQVWHTQEYDEGELVRPESVPEGAVWVPDDWQWELAPTDDDGQNHGNVRWWRPDGTLACETHFEHGVPTGSGQRYHESGKHSQTYTFVDGQLHGERTWYHTDEFTTEQTRTPGLAKSVVKTVMIYDKGQPKSTHHYDADGHEVNAQGVRI
jgi:antitoxin component YwqK of YwqJK toxin-antitoxin module